MLSRCTKVKRMYITCAHDCSHSALLTVSLNHFKFHPQVINTKQYDYIVHCWKTARRIKRANSGLNALHTLLIQLFESVCHDHITCTHVGTVHYDKGTIRDVVSYRDFVLSVLFLGLTCTRSLARVISYLHWKFGFIWIKLAFLSWPITFCVFLNVTFPIVKVIILW